MGPYLHFTNLAAADPVRSNAVARRLVLLRKSRRTHHGQSPRGRTIPACRRPTNIHATCFGAFREMARRSPGLPSWDVKAHRHANMELYGTDRYLVRAPRIPTTWRRAGQGRRRLGTNYAGPGLRITRLWANELRDRTRDTRRAPNYRHRRAGPIWPPGIGRQQAAPLRLGNWPFM